MNQSGNRPFKDVFLLLTTGAAMGRETAIPWLVAL